MNTCFNTLVTSFDNCELSTFSTFLLTGHLHGHATPLTIELGTRHLHILILFYLESICPTLEHRNIYFVFIYTIVWEFNRCRVHCNFHLVGFPLAWLSVLTHGRWACGSVLCGLRCLTRLFD